MPQTHHVFWHPKQGNRADEYEDAFAVNPAAGRFAVADGATESAFAALWAQTLVRHFVETPNAGLCPCAPWLVPAQQEWLAAFGGRDLPYAVEAHVRAGAFATFLGLLILPENGTTYRWRAMAVGDTCLFQTRGNSLLRAFPLERSDSFGSAPPLIGSRMPLGDVEQKHARTAEDKCAPRDRLWLMTDAISQWFLRECEAGKTPWVDLEWLFQQDVTQEHFALWLEWLHGAKKIRNDDVTLLVIELE